MLFKPLRFALRFQHKESVGEVSHSMFCAAYLLGSAQVWNCFKFIWRLYNHSSELHLPSPDVSMACGYEE